ncbi:MAG: PQQ-like beta-propeller repeat protein [Akkermansiaceae bacterium]|nr:PQQ-like beta-propeller repeat protein [Armatimonadota bacterium]
MKQVRSLQKAGLLGLLSVSLCAVAVADDWTQWRGPGRTGVSREVGMLKTWPEGGPKLLWSAKDLGEGHSAPSVAKGRIFGMGVRGEKETVWALDEKTGKEVWSTPIAGTITLEGRQGGYGSRATPTVDGTYVYSLGVGGELVCLESATGKLVWKKNLVSDFGGAVPRWGYSESPLVDGENVIATPGGSTATMVALNKKTGAVAWKSADPQGSTVAYSSAIAADVSGQRQYIQFLTGGVVGLRATDGKQAWHFAAPASRGGINCSTPIFDKGYVFAAAAYGHGGGLAQLTTDAGLMAVKEVYFTKQMQNHHGGMVLVGDYLYGFDNSTLTCLEFKTGKVMWAERSVGKGSVMAADGLLYCRSERGPVALVEANPKEYVEKARFEQPERSNEPSWAYPVISDGKLYLRDQGVLLCYAVK